MEDVAHLVTLAESVGQPETERAAALVIRREGGGGGESWSVSAQHDVQR